MRKVAFIDVQNTETTALRVLKFAIDYERLFLFLKDTWGCDRVFFYPGIQYGDEVRDSIFLKLKEIGAIVKPKYYLVYKNEDKLISTRCPKCNMQITQQINMGHSWKCNCDVELTIDVLDNIDKDVEIILFTGDGDFELLIKKAIEAESKITIVSSARKLKVGSRYSTSRLSTKLRRLTKENGLPVRFLELNNLLFRINKET